MSERPAASVRHQLVHEWNDNPSPSGGGSFLERVHGWAESRPEAPAVVFESADGRRRSLGYRRLRRMAGSLARRLRQLGVKPETRVGLLVERSPERVLGFLAILEAGGVYVPLDPGHPRGRLAEILADTGMELLVTRRALAPRLPEERPCCLWLDDEDLAGGDGPLPSLLGGFHPESLAYLIHTSGSSGRPKGVAMGHGGLAYLAAAGVLGVEPGDGVAQLAAPTFDVSILEMVETLGRGGTLHVAPEGAHLSGEPLFAFLKASRVRHLAAIPSVLTALPRGAERSLGDLERITFGGEPCPVEPLERWQEGRVRTNSYGPTEAAVCATLSRGFLGPAGTAIGRAVPGARVYVVDSRLELVSVSEPGELVIAGSGLARGYWRRSAETASRYVPDPFAATPGGRLYRTGDRVRWMPRGHLEFLGRVDRQVKVRGVRVEPGEVESALRELKSVRESAVVPYTSRAGGLRLAAFVVSGGDPLPAGAGQDEQVEHWRHLYEDVYRRSFAGETGEGGEASLLAGWQSSYTGEPIPLGEMLEWLDATLERILELRPRRLLEIGCGSGLLLGRLAPRVERYVGTDFASTVLDFVRVRLERGDLRGRGANVELRHQPADDFSGLPAGSFDTVVMNSVSQHFPGAGYFLEVLRGIERVLAPGGSLFLGDVRSLPLHEAFCASVELHKAAPDLPVSELRRRVRRRRRREEEMLVAPSFFHALKGELPRLRQVHLRPKRGRAANELNRFRFDATLVFDRPAPRREVSVLDGPLPPAEIVRRLAEEKPPVMVLRGVPDRRVAADLRLAEVLAGPEAPATAGELAALLDGAAPPAFAPEDFEALTEGLPYIAEPRCFDAGRFSVVFRRHGTAPPALEPPAAPVSPASSYVHHPLRERFHRRWVPRLREALGERLPPALVPSTFAVLDAMPRTVHGKVDRAALEERAAEIEAGRTGRAEDAPRDGVEERLAAIWSDLLGIDEVGVHDNFFELGGHSLAATQLVSRVRDSLGVELPLPRLFESPTVAALASHLTASGAAPAPPPVSVAPREDAGMPLSSAQRRLWFLSQMAPESTAWNVQEAWEVRGRLDVAAFTAALDEIVRRHEVLRTTYRERGGETVQVISPPFRAELPEVDLGGLGEARRAAELRRLAEAMARTPFDLARGPLTRFVLARLGDGAAAFLRTIHHSVSDGWSQTVFRRELEALYAAFHRREPSPLDPLPVQYADFAVWQRRLAGSRLAAEQLGWWRERLAGLARLELPADRPRPAVPSGRSAIVGLAFDGPLLASLKSLGEKRGASLFMTAAAAFAALLGRYTGERDVAFGIPVANRRRRELEGLIGLFVNVLVLRSDLDGDPGFGELVERVRGSALGAYAHQDLPFERLVEELRPERELDRHPLVQVAFAVHAAPSLSIESGGLELTPLDLAHRSMIDLEVHLWERGGRLEGYLVYQTDLYDVTRLRRFAGHFEALLRQAVAEPDRPLSRLSALSPPERHQLLREWNDSAAAGSGGTFLDLFAGQVRRRGEAPALEVAGGPALCYAELDERSRRLGHHLVRRGVRRGDRVGIWAERSPDLVVGLLAVLRAGAAFVPLDPEYPEPRLRQMAADAGLRAVLTRRGSRGRVGGEAVYFDEAGEGDAPLPAVTGEDLAYVVFTSGSTGRPKGVACAHRGWSNLIAAQAKLFRVGAGDRMLQFASPSFDAFVSEVGVTLGSGATLVLARRDELLGGPPLAALLDRAAITHVTLPPSSLAVMDVAELPGLRTLVVAGEACPAELAARWRRGRLFLDAYGPTEASVCATAGVSAIGRPIANLEVHVAGERLEPLPVGTVGELWIGGPWSLAHGYLGQPGRTAERFVPDPWSGRPGSRLYRSGDLGRRRGDGELIFTGRRDAQVKLRGFRVEPGEAEAVLLRAGDVREAAVVARPAGTGLQLAAYVVPRPETEGAAELEDEHVRSWQALYDDVHAGEEVSEFSGWLSSYTGEPLPEDEMRAWLDATVEAVLGLAPRRALEIGCGSGLIAERVAPSTVSYLGTDFSGPVLERLAARSRTPRLRLRRMPATGVTDLPAGSFDTVVLNSVAQYFPSAGYLFEVLAGAVRAAAPGGKVFVGDVRHLGLFERFCGSLELHGAPDGLPVAELRERIWRRTVKEEEELLLHPAFFRRLGERLPRVGHAEVRLKRGGYDNELSRYRYDVVLHLDVRSEILPGGWLDYRREGLTPASLRRRLEAERPEVLGLCGVPHRGLEADNRLLELLDDEAWLRRPAAELRTRASVSGVEPEALARLGAALGYRVELGWGDGRSDGGFTVLFDRRPGAPRVTPPAPAAEGPLTNDPLRARRTARWVPELRRRLAKALPAYMVPASIVVLDALPRLPNGKLDRRALPSPEELRRTRGEDLQAPRDATEGVLHDLWCEVLGTGEVGVFDDFFELGGHSLLATRIVSRVREVFGVELSVRQVFERPTVAGLASALTSAGAPAPPPVERRGEDAPPELSFAQERLWFLERLNPGSTAYHMPGAWRIAGELDVAVLAAALGEVARRHEVLRTVFADDGGTPRAVVAAPSPWKLPVVDLAVLGEARRERELDRLIRLEAVRTFDLERGPLLRTTAVRLAAASWALLTNGHHVASDGASQPVFYGELGRLYEAFSRGRPSPLPEPPLQYADFAAWQRGWLRGEVLSGQLAYWRTRLAAAADLDLPADHPRPPVATGSAKAVDFAWDGLADSLKGLGRERQASLFMVLAAAFAVLAGRYAGQDDVVFGTPVANRRRRELEGLLGLFVNTLVLRVGVGGDPTFHELLEQVRETALEAYAHQDVPFERLVEELEVPRRLDRNPLFQVLLAVHEKAPGGTAFGGLELEPLPLVPRATVDLELHFGEDGDGRLRGRAVFRDDLFHVTRIRRMVTHLETLLCRMAAAPERPLSRHSPLTAVELQQLREWNDTARPDVASSFVELFASQVARDAGTCALAWNDGDGTREELSYGGLAHRARSLAGRLRRRGVAPGDRVGLLIDRSPAYVVALLAVAQAGAAFVPLDPSYPRERLHAMIDDAGVKLLLADAGSLEALGGEGPRFLVVSRGGLPLFVEAADESEPLPGASPESLAYVLYTSGSTGRPKGVACAHRGWASLAREVIALSGIGPGKRMLQLTSPSFDVFLAEVGATLASGATLELAAREEILPGRGLIALLERLRITHLAITPSSLAVLDADGGLPHLETLLVAGEACPGDLVERWGRGRRLLNAYGPTEATVYATAATCRPGGGKPPIGRPLAHLTAHVLGRRFDLLPAGAPGELALGGPFSLARGYLGQPGLTAGRFVPDPWSAAPGARLYLTGDLVTRRAGGELEFLGRLDAQVKLRGFRVEPGEVEAALRRDPRVAEAVVAVHVSAAGDPRLAAWIAVRDAGAAEAGTVAASLRARLEASLPSYMVPSALVTLAELPRLPNGKVDRRSLPPPGEERGGRERRPPRDATEAAVLDLWSEVLGGEVGVEDNFFELGGHSLLATRLVSRIERALGVEVPVRRFFERPTVAAFAAGLVSQPGRSGAPRPGDFEEAELDAAAGGADPGEAERLLARLLQAGVQLRRRDRRLVLRGPCGLAGDLLRAAEGAAAGLAELVGDGRKLAPTTLDQEKVWRYEAGQLGPGLWNIALGWRLSGVLDDRLLEAALAAVVARHDTLRTSFTEVGGRPVQVVDEHVEVGLERVDLTGLPREAARAEARRRVEAEAWRRFDLASAPLLRVVLFTLAGDERFLLLALHHLVGDGVSGGIVTRELAAFYSDPGSAPDPLPMQYGDYAAMQRRLASGAVARRHAEHWGRVLRPPLPPAPLRTDRPRGIPVPGRHRRIGVEVGPHLTAALEQLAASEKASLFMALVAGLLALLRARSGQDDVMLVTRIARRDRGELEGLVGYLLNSLVVRLAVEDGLTFRGLLRRVRHELLGGIAHQEVPLESLLPRIAPGLGADRPLSQLGFIFHNFPEPRLVLSGVGLEPVPILPRRAQFDLLLHLAPPPETLPPETLPPETLPPETLPPEGRGLSGILVYDGHLFDASTVEGLMREYRGLLEAVAEDPDGNLPGRIEARPPRQPLAVGRR